MSSQGAPWIVRMAGGLLVVTFAVAQGNAPVSPPTAHRVLRTFGGAGSTVTLSDLVGRRSARRFPLQLPILSSLLLRCRPKTPG